MSIYTNKYKYIFMSMDYRRKPNQVSQVPIYIYIYCISLYYHKYVCVCNGLLCVM